MNFIQTRSEQFCCCPFPVCNETGQPLAFHYGIEGEKNCTNTETRNFYFKEYDFEVVSL